VCFDGRRELFEFTGEGVCRISLRGSVVKREFDDTRRATPSGRPFPRNSLPGEDCGAFFSCVGSRGDSVLAVHLIDFRWNRLLMASRFSFPLAVRRAFSGVKTSWENQEIADLAIVRQFGVDHIQRGLNGI
jgi:hypothetical protein